MSITLHDFQERLLQDIRTVLRRGAKSVLAVAPTGSGKTVIMSRIAKGICGHGQRLPIVVHRDELIDSTCGELQAAGVDLGIAYSF